MFMIYYHLNFVVIIEVVLHILNLQDIVEVINKKMETIEVNDQQSTDKSSGSAPTVSLKTTEDEKPVRKKSVKKKMTDAEVYAALST